jgi:hypothetical protein
MLIVLCYFKKQNNNDHPKMLQFLDFTLSKSFTTKSHLPFIIKKDFKQGIKNFLKINSKKY